MKQPIEGEATRVPDDLDAVEVQKVLGGDAGLDGLNAEAMGGEPEGELPPERTPTRDQIRKPFLKGFKAFAPAWNAPEDEITDFSDALGDVVDKWFPDTGLPGFLDRWGAELALAWTGYCLLSPRVGMPLRHPPKPEPAPEKTDGAN